METFALVAAALAAATASLIGARRVAGQLAAFVRRQDRIDQALVVVDRELTVDDNGSLKSRVVKLGAQLDQAQADVTTVKEEVGHVQGTIDSHVGDPQAHNRDPHAHTHDMDT